MRKPMILTDGTHLVGYPLEKLHKLAESVGLKRSWYQDHPKHPHYDILSKDIMKKILLKGAVLATKKQIINFFKINSKEVRHV
jgi:hypothetical protein